MERASREPIRYIRERIPEFAVPAYEGERYDVLVPDTLDLQERAALAVNGLTGPTDPEADSEIYWLVNFNYNPAMMQHDNNDHLMAKFVQSLPLLRLASGCLDAPQVERDWLKALLHMQGPDGLLYWPTVGRPWWNRFVYGRMPEVRDHYCTVHMVGGYLGAVSLYYTLTGDKVWLETGQRIADGLTQLAIDDGDAAYFQAMFYGEGGEPPKDYSFPPHQTVLPMPWIIQGLSQFHRVSGYEPAGKLAGKLARYITERSGHFGPDGEWTIHRSPQPGLLGNWEHFHNHSLILLSLLEYGLAADDRSFAEFARRGFEYGKTCGEPLTGFFPERINSKDLEHSEGCEVADMIALGCKLSEAGVGDYWDDVDRWVRNMLAEGQLTQTDWIARATEWQPKSAIDESWQTTDRVAERNLGAFAGWPKMNEWHDRHGVDPYDRMLVMGIMHCCTGNASRAVYYAWDRILRCDGGKLRVNLLLNRASPWADVDSHVPYQGQVDVRVKQPAELAIRIPEWVKPAEARVQVGGQDRRIQWEGRYAVVGAVRPGDVATLTFPIFERTDMVFVEKERYTLVRKGNDVVAIDPPGRYGPLYQRNHYRVNSTRWRRIERFVPKLQVRW